MANLTPGDSGLLSCPLFVIHPPILPSNGATIAMANPLAAVDQQIATWFHTHLGHTLVGILKALTELGSGEWIGIALVGIISLLAWKRSWVAIAMLIVAVPGGMLLNELIKLEVHRARPFFTDSFGVWTGYSFASGHTIGATLLYGQLALLIVPALKSRHLRLFALVATALLVLLVGFTRIALGAHYFTDVLGAMVLGTAWLMFCVVAAKPLLRIPAAVVTEDSR